MSRHHATHSFTTHRGFTSQCRCCTQCGNVLDEAAFSSDVTFTKGPGGESAVDGQRVSEGGVARGMGRIAGGRVYGHQVRRALLSLNGNGEDDFMT